MRKLSTDLIKSGSFTGSFSGSFVGLINSSSYSQTASFSLNTFSLTTGSTYSITSSWSNNSVSSSFSRNSISSSYSNTASNLSPVAQDLIPFTSSTYSLGSATNKWKDLYVSTGSIYIGDTVLTTSGSSLYSNNSPIVTLNTASGQIQVIGFSSSLSASFATNAGTINNTSSNVFATTGSNTFNGSQTVQGNITVIGSLIAQQYVVSSSVSYFTSSYFDGSTKFGDNDSDTHQFTGSLRAPNITGSLLGTSSFSNNSTSASYSLTSSIALNALTSSYINIATNAVSSSYAATASISTSSSFASTSSYNLNSISSSYSLTASYASNAGSSLTTGSTYPITSSWSNNSISSSYALNAGSATTATSANTATSSSFATTAGTATTATSTTSASYALTASYALNASGGGGGSGTVTGSVNYIAKFTSGSSVGNSVIYETGSNIGIGTTTPNSKLNVNSSGSLASGSVVFSVEGTQGSLFSVDDSLSGSLMSVNDISGLPILEVFSDDRLVVGTFNANTLVVTGSRVGIGTSVPIAKLQVSGSISGSSFTSSVSNGVGFLGTSSFSVTSSYALNALTASYALNASGGGGGSGTVTGSINYIAKFTTTTSVGTSSIYETGSYLGIGTTNPNSKLNVNSSGSLASGSVVFSVEGTQGSLFSVDDSLSGSLMSVNDISGLPILEVFSDDRLVVGTYNSNALVVTGSKVGIGTSVPIAKLQVNGNISGSSFTGSVFGTSSWSINTTSASYALSASYAPGLTTGSTYPITSSWATNAISSSFATTSTTATSATSANSATSASFATTSSFSSNSTSASYSLSSSYSVNSNISVSSSFASTASYNLNSISSSYALSASYAPGGGTSLTTGSTYPITSSWSNNAITASYALVAGSGGSSSSTSSLIGQTFVPTASINQLSLTQSVSNNDQILVILDGLVQSRTGSYTVTGSTLNLTENADSGSVIDVRFLAGSSLSSSFATTSSFAQNTAPRTAIYRYGTTSVVNPGSYAYTIIKYDTAVTDSTSWYDNTTGKFTPTVAGWYQVSAGARVYGSSGTAEGYLVLFKNGTEIASNGGIGAVNSVISLLVYFNGSSDYIQLYSRTANAITNAQNSTNAPFTMVYITS